MAEQEYQIETVRSDNDPLQEVIQNWYQYPDKTRHDTIVLLEDHSATLSHLRNSLIALGKASKIRGIDEAIDDGMLFAYSLIRAQRGKKALPEIQEDPNVISDKIAPLWYLLPNPTGISQLEVTDIIPPLLFRNPEVGEAILEKAHHRSNRGYFIAGAALVTQLFYEAALPKAA